MIDCLSAPLQTFLFDIPLQTLIDRAHAALDKLISHVVHNDVITTPRGNLGDTIAHGAGTDYSNKFTHCPGTPGLSPIGRGWRWEILTVALLLDTDRKTAWKRRQSVLWPIIKQLTGFTEEKPKCVDANSVPVGNDIAAVTQPTMAAVRAHGLRLRSAYPATIEGSVISP
jgi:hypothetical protein